MKKKILSFCLAFAVIVPAIFLLSACGGNDTPKKDRTNTAEIVDIYQDPSAGVYVEVTGFEHTDWEFISNSGYNACTLEFSINDGEWFTGSIVQDFYDENGKGVYQILNANYQLGDSEITSYSVLMTGQTVSPGEITVSARIPESNTYNASAGTSPTTYTLKSKIQTIDDKIGAGLYGFGSQGTSNSPEEEKFVFYQDSSNPYNLKVGKFYSQANESGESISYDRFVRELTAEEETQFSEFDLEYKVVNYTSKYITTVEGSEYENIATMEITSDENDAVYSTEGWTDRLSLSKSNLWSYTNAGDCYKSVIFLVRLKATDDTVQSEALCFEANIEIRVQDNPVVYEGFVFDNNKLIGYLGNETEIVVPSSYSIRNTNTDIYTIEYNIRDIINYGDESSLDYEIWAEDLNEYDIFILVGGMYNVSINNGEKQYVRVGEAEEFFTQVKEKYTDPTTTISIELTDYTLSEEDEINESNLTIIFRPFMEMLAGNLESFSMTYDGEKVDFTKENYLQQYSVFTEIISAGSLKSDISYDIGNYIEYIEGDDYRVDTITSLSPDYAMGGGLFAIPQLTKITIPASITTIDEGVFKDISTLSSVIVESATIYNALTDLNACGNLIVKATEIRVLKTIVDDTANTNEFLNTTGGYTKTEDGNYYIYSK